MECLNCGKQNRDIARFCQHCGALLTATEAADVILEEVQPLEEESAPGPQVEATAEAAAHLEERALPLPEGSPDEATVSQDSTREDVEETERTSEPAPPSQEPQLAPIALEREAMEPAADVSQTALLEEAPTGPEEAGDTPGAAREQVSLSVESVQESTTPPERELSTPGPQPETVVGETGPGIEAQEEPELVLLEPSEEEPTITGECPESIQELVDAGLLPWSDRSEPVETLELGTVVNGRYQISEVLLAEDQQALYRVRDLQRCSRCGYTDNSPDEAFCASCGAVMDQKPVATMLETLTEQSEAPVEVEAEDHFVKGGRSYWVWREVKQEAAMQEVQQTMRLIVGQKSDTGQVRELDEDSLLVLTMSVTYESVVHQLGLFVLADGMGGHEGGEVASQVAIQTLAQTLLRNVFTPELADDSLSPEAIQDWIVKAIREANERVYLERQKRDNDMGTTVTAAFVEDWTLYLAHVGDCRAYRWGADGLQQLTTDHSLVAGMVAAGTVGPEEIYTHPQRSVIYRSVGDHPTVEVDTSTLALSPGDRLVLCCDGLWEMLHNEGIEEVMLRESDPQTACDIMVEQANLAGGADNISVIVVQL